MGKRPQLRINVQSELAQKKEVQTPVQDQIPTPKAAMTMTAKAVAIAKGISWTSQTQEKQANGLLATLKESYVPLQVLIWNH